MRIPPLNVILSWPTPNYVDPPTRGLATLVVNATFATLVVIAVAGRFYSRLFVQRMLGIDDWMMIPAFIFSICMSVVVGLANMRYGWDRHIWDVAPSLIQNANIIALIAKLTFTCASTFTRLSLLCFYYRLVKDSGVKWFRWVLHASLAWIGILGIVFVCLSIWLCQPVQCYWVYPPMEPCTCLNEGKVLVGGGVANCFTDALVTLLPIPIVLRLQMPLTKRLGICVLLCLGIVVTIAGAVRTYYSWKGLLASWDETWWSNPLWMAAAVEIELAVICACAPAWKTLLHRPIQKISTKMSSQLSSLRSRSSRSNATLEKRNTAIFNPLRSLQWFHLKTLRFDPLRTRSSYHESVVEDSTRDKGGVILWTIAVPGDHEEDAYPPSRFSDDYPSNRCRSPRLEITMRKSFEQTSTRLSSYRQS